MFVYRELLWTLSQEELRYLERLLCNLEETKIKPSADQSVEPGLCSQEHNNLTNSDSRHNICSAENSSNAQLNQPASSLFNNISNINDLPQTGQSEMVNSQTARPSIFDMLSVSPDNTQPLSDGSSDGNGNNNEDTLSQEHQQSQETDPDQSNAVIINDQVSGIARLIIGSLPGEEAPSIARESAPHTPDTVPTDSQHQTTNNIAQQRRHQSDSSLHEVLQQFSFNLPRTNQTDNGTSSPRHHVTIARSLSQESPQVGGETMRPETGNVVRRCDTTSEESGSSSESSAPVSDSDSFSSGPEDSRYVAHIIVEQIQISFGLYFGFQFYWVILNESDEFS